MTLTIPDFWCGFIAATIFWFLVLAAVAAHGARKQKDGAK